jgi:hypothetical protein
MIIHNRCSAAPLTHPPTPTCITGAAQQEVVGQELEDVGLSMVLEAVDLDSPLVIHVHVPEAKNHSKFRQHNNTPPYD